jgi:hypothetical protein
VKLRNFQASFITATVLCASLCHAAAPAKLRVSATILPFLSLNAVQNVTTYQVKTADIQRGYIDLPNAITIKVRTNLNTGVPVIVENSGTAKVLIKEKGRPVFVGNTFTVDASEFRPNLPFSKDYDSRIILSSDAQEGNFPLLISITPAI